MLKRLLRRLKGRRVVTRGLAAEVGQPKAQGLATRKHTICA